MARDLKAKASKHGLGAAAGKEAFPLSRQWLAMRYTALRGAHSVPAAQRWRRTPS